MAYPQGDSAALFVAGVLVVDSVWLGLDEEARHARDPAPPSRPEGPIRHRHVSIRARRCVDSCAPVSIRARHSRFGIL